MTPAKQPSGKATSDMTAPAKKTKQKAKATKPSTSASKNAGKQKASAKKATNNAAVTEPRLDGMGAIVSSDGVGFRVWAPNANTVSVIGHFNDWADDADRLASEGNWFWYGFVKGAKAGDEDADALRRRFGFQRSSARGVSWGELEVVDDAGDVEP